MRRPKVIISSAVSADGKLSTSDRRRFMLSNMQDMKAVDRLRAEADAILVGSTTLKNDDPSLTIKLRKNIYYRISCGKRAQPVKVAISKICDISPDSKFMTRGDAEKIIFTTREAPRPNIDALKGGATIIRHGKRVDVKKLLDTLYDKGIRMLVVEGGGSTNAAFLRAGAVDEIRLAVSPMIIGEKGSPSLADGPIGMRSIDLRLTSMEKLDGMAILHYKVIDKKNG
jgi:5-amino-6-(5-phosphoribosylamino)uracil reductase